MKNSLTKLAVAAVIVVGVCLGMNHLGYRLVLLFLKAIRLLYPDYALWRHFDYEYEKGRLPFDVINGGTSVREWIEDNTAGVDAMDGHARGDPRRGRYRIAGCGLICRGHGQYPQAGHP